MSPEARGSLLAVAERQPEFSLTAEAADLFTATEAQGEYTAARLFEKRPMAYRAVVGLTAEGRGVLKIAGLLGIGAHTVLAVQAREGVAIQQERHDLAQRFRSGARVAAEAALDAIADPNTRSKCNALQLATAAAILTDKAELLSGNAPSIRIEVEHHASPDQFAELIAEAAARKMDSSRADGGQKGASAVDLEPGPGGVWSDPQAGDQGADDARSDIDSVVSDGASRCDATPMRDDACGDACGGAAGGPAGGAAGAGADGLEQGGGGGRARDGGGIS